MVALNQSVDEGQNGCRHPTIYISPLGRKDTSMSCKGAIREFLKFVSASNCALHQTEPLKLTAHLAGWLVDCEYSIPYPPPNGALR